MKMIEGWPLVEALRRIRERRPFISIWRKASNVRLVRFFNWGA